MKLQETFQLHQFALNHFELLDSFLSNTNNNKDKKKYIKVC